jgi:hypothetical protein
MTANSCITAISGYTEVAGTLAIAAPRGLYAVVSERKPKKNPKELLPAAPADRASGIRLIKSYDRKTDNIINRPDRSTYPEEKTDNHLAGLRAARESGGVKVKVRTYFDPTEAV